MLHLKAGDPLRIYFIIDNQVRARRLVIAGIYSTGLEEFDRLYIFGDIGQIQGLNGWESDEVSGYEIMINRFRDLTEVSDQVYRSIGYDLDAMSIRDLYPQLFDWLDLQDMNVVIILVLMILVSGIAMISTLLVLILERTAMIGVLKALGSRNSVIRKVFIYNAIYILTRGLLWGNLVGISLCLVQKYTGWVQLPEESYFMSVVPIHLAVTDIVLLNMGTLFLCTLMMIIPSLVIARISPVKAIRLE
jgi:lipoprotein-releasing system permease protein